MIYELRTYRCLPGRLPALLKRFETTTVPLFAKHGINPVGFWTTVVGESHLDLTYLIAWESMGDREVRWNTFQADPEWQEKRLASEIDGPIVSNIVNSFLQPTSFSALK